jgi:hypothetical protein
MSVRWLLALVILTPEVFLRKQFATKISLGKGRVNESVNLLKSTISGQKH